MFKNIVTLIDRVDQCLSVLHKIYALLKERAHSQPLSADKNSTVEPRSAMPLSLIDIEAEDILLNIDEACDKLGIARTTLRSLRARGLISDVKQGGRCVRFRASDVERLCKWYSVPKGKV